MHMKCMIGDNISFNLSTMMRVFNKVLLSVSTEPNIMEISDNNKPIKVYRYTFQHCTQRFFLGDYKGWFLAFASFSTKDISLGAELCLDKAFGA